MPRIAPLLFALLFTSLAAAQAPAPAPKKPPPSPTSLRNRPGMQWFEAMPSKGGKQLVMNLQGMETNWFEVAPGEEIEIPVTGPTRLRVQARIEFLSREEAAREYSITWSIDKGAKQRKGFKAEPEKVAFYKGLPGAVPGSRDDMVIDVPADGPHTVVFSWGKTRPAGVTMRFFTEVPKPPKGIRREPKAQHVDSWWMKIENRLRIGYGDNVWSLSDRDVHAWEEENTNDEYDRFDKIESVDDVWFTSEFEMNLISPRTGIGRFMIALQVNDKLYVKSHERNTDEFQVSVKHRVAKDFSYKVFGSFLPDRYVRELDSADTAGTSLSHAHYSNVTAGLRVWYRWAPSISTTFQFMREHKNYNTNFNERDQFLHHFDLGVRLEVAKWLTLDFDFEHIHARSKSHGNDVDTSFREFSPRLELNMRYKTFIFGGGYRFEDRRYTTRNSRAVDPEHAGRRNFRHVWKAYIGIEYKDSVFTLEYTRIHRTCHLPGRQSSEDAFDFDDAFESDSNALEFTWAFKFN